MRLLENILLAGQQFLNGIHISRLVKCQLKMANIQGDQAELAAKVKAAFLF
jgi:hypothetical protein